MLIKASKHSCKGGGLKIPYTMKDTELHKGKQPPNRNENTQNIEVLWHTHTQKDCTTRDCSCSMSAASVRTTRWSRNCIAGLRKTKSTAAVSKTPNTFSWDLLARMNLNLCKAVAPSPNPARSREGHSRPKSEDW